MRLGEMAEVGVLRVTVGRSWPGMPRAAGSFACAHLLEAMACLALGAAAAVALPVPGWARWTMVGGFVLASGAVGLAALLHGRARRLLTAAVHRFLAAAAAHAGGILLATWVARSPRASVDPTARRDVPIRARQPTRLS